MNKEKSMFTFRAPNVGTSQEYGLNTHNVSHDYVVSVTTPRNVSDIDEIIFSLINGNTVGDVWVDIAGDIFYRKNNEVLAISGIDKQLLKPEIMYEWLSRAAGDLSIINTAKDTSYTISRGSISRRFRVNAYKSLGKIRVCLRLVADSVSDPNTLRVPQFIINQFCNYSDGLVLVCGATGSGKSTTIASLLSARAASRREHVITLEDPIEYLFKDSKSFFSQREKGTDFSTYPEAIRHAMRESPDTIFIGEIRDSETAEAALQAAETGHLVVSTMHTRRAPESLERFMLMFPESDKNRILSMMSSVTRFVLCQRLIPTISGARIALFEPMVVNEPSNLQPVIRKGEKLANSLRNTMEQTNYAHNYSFQKDLLNLRHQGIINQEIYDAINRDLEC